jgi:predicted Zn-dependent protease
MSWLIPLSRRFLLLAGLIFLPTAAGTFAAQDNPSGNFKALATAAAEARDENNTEEALRNYRAALGLRPDWKEGWWSVGVLEYQQDGYGEAAHAFEKLTELAPDAGAAWNFLGLCEFETKDYERALRDLTRAGQLGGVEDPEIQRVTQYHLALLLTRAGRFEEAGAILRVLIGAGAVGTHIDTALGLAVLRVPLLPEESDPSRDSVLQEVGSAAALEAGGKDEAALESFAEVVQKYPDAPHLRMVYGAELFKAGKTAEALQQVDAEISRWPRDAGAHTLRAEILEAQGHRDKANAERKTAAQLQTANSDWLIAQYRGAAGNRAAKIGAVGSGGNLNSSLFERAMNSYSAHKYDETINELKPWLEDHPNEGTAWAVMGLAEFELKDYDNALIHLQRGQALGLKGSAESVQLARYRLAVLLNQRGKFENAEALLFSVAGSGPLAAQVREALGLSMLRMAILPEEVDAARKPLVNGAGEIAELLKDSLYDQAFPKFEALLAKYPAAPFLHYAYGTALATFSRYDDAAKQFQREIVISPDSALPQIELAAVALKQRRADEALAPAQSAVKLAPESGEAHYVLGRAYLELGQNQQAIAELETAVKLSPESAQIHFNLAKAYAKADLPEKAEQERAIFTQLNAAVEEQRSHSGSQSYGAHNAAEQPAEVSRQQ